MAGESPAADRVVITGVGLATGLGLDADSVWNAIVSGRVGLGPIPIVESALPQGTTGGQALEIPPGYHPDLPREARYLRWVVEHALRDAGDPQRTYPPPRCYAMLGTTLHGMRAGGRFLRRDDPAQLLPFLASSTAHLAIRGLGIQGGVATTCSACSSSLGAVALGATLLVAGQADMVVAGGYDAIGEYVWAGFNALRLISPTDVLPFAKRRQGMKVAEGYGVVVLERAPDAARRGARVLGVLEGWGESADAHHLTQPHPEGEGAARAMRAALDRAGATPADLDMVAAHATATRDNDAAEYHALRRALESRLAGTPVVGFKSYLGHTLGGAGAVELILTLCCLRAGLIPACAGVTPEEVEFPSLRVAPPGGIKGPIRRAMNTSLGFGGANTCVVVARPEVSREPQRSGPDPTPAPEAWITGIGLVLPGISSVAALIARLDAGEGPLFPASAAGRSVGDEQLAQIMNVRRVRRVSVNVKLMLAAATSAAADAGVAHDPERLSEASAILASMHGSTGFCLEYYGQLVREGVAGANPVLFAEGVPNAAAAHVSANLGIRGGCQTIIGARTAGLDALGLATLRIRTGAAAMVLVGAAEEPNTEVERVYRWFGLQRREDGTAPGFVATSGGVAFVVESSLSAARRGARPLARVSGVASGALSPLGPARTLRRVLNALGPVEHVLGSRNGTWIDRAEDLAIRGLGWSPSVHSPAVRFGEMFAAGPLASIAWALGCARFPRFAAVCSDFVDAASGVMIEKM